jgi:undecaprenyl-diphosphatase
MSHIEALLLGILQGLTEFLPVSSSGHLEIANHFLGINAETNLAFTTAVHAGTVFSTIVVLRREIWGIIKGVVSFKMTPETQLFLRLLVSAVPILIVGLLLKDQVEALFGGSLLVVGLMLILTAILLTVSHYAPQRNKEVSILGAFIIGIGQAVAVMPGLSRSGTTISTGLMLGVKRENVAKFSFLMVIIPIVGATFLEVLNGDFGNGDNALPWSVVAVGFFSAFLSGLLACKAMIRLVSRSHMLWFALYCLVVGGAITIYNLIG